MNKLWKSLWKGLKSLMSRIHKKFEGFSLSEYLVRMSSRKLGVIMTFAGVAYYLNSKDRLSQAMADVLVGLALAYCGANLLQKKMGK